MVQLAGCLPNMREAVGLIPSPIETEHNPSALEVETGRSEAQGHPGQHPRFDAILEYMRACPKTHGVPH